MQPVVVESPGTARQPTKGKPFGCEHSQKHYWYNQDIQSFLLCKYIQPTRATIKGVKVNFVGISLITQNVPGLAVFYSQVLGVKAEGDETHVVLNTSGAEMTIFSADGMENLAPGSMQGAGHGGFTMGFEVQDVDSEFERIKAMDVEIVKLPVTHPWGTRSFWFRDPDGNIINFFSNRPGQLQE